MDNQPFKSDLKSIKLPKPNLDGTVSVEQALHTRRSVREFSSSPLSLTEISQILWSAQGITTSSGSRTAPSAGALYPLEVYILSANVENLSPGLYKYSPKGHEIIFIIPGDLRRKLESSALGQECITSAPASIILSAVYRRTTHKYGDRGIQYVHMEIGHVAENIYLQAVSLNLGTVSIGAFYDHRVKKNLCLPENEEPLLIMPIGKLK